MKKFLLACALGLGLTASAAAQQSIFRVNCGGTTYIDTKGQIWQADFAFSGGAAESTTAAISGTSDPVLFQTVRWNPTSYTFTTQPGTYTVNLLFAEVNTSITTGGRIFNVKMQGATVLQNFDTFAAAGGWNKAVVKTVNNVAVVSGTLLIEFVRVSGLMPKIMGIEILPAIPAGSPRLMLNFVHPDGSAVSGKLTFKVNSSLANLQGSVPLVNGQASCYLLNVPSALGLGQQYQAALTLTDDAGKTLWQFSLGLNPSNVNFVGVRDSVLTVVIQP